MQVENKIRAFNLTRHAQRRLTQRRIGADELRVVLEYGRSVHRAGIKFIFLGHRDLPASLVRRYDYLIGTTILIAKQEVITIYKNRNALAVIKRKSKLDLRKG